MKVEYKLPMGYRWVKAGDFYHKNDMEPDRLGVNWIYGSWWNSATRVSLKGRVIRKIKRKKP